MNYTFKPDYMFTKGIVYAEFFDPATDNLVGFSKYVTDFGPVSYTHLTLPTKA